MGSNTVITCFLSLLLYATWDIKFVLTLYAIILRAELRTSVQTRVRIRVGDLCTRSGSNNPMNRLLHVLQSVTVPDPRSSADG